LDDLIARKGQQTGEEVIGREALKRFCRQQGMTKLDARLIR
jgi:hypothetical protein